MTVELVTEGATVRIDPDHGARLASLQLGGHEVLVTDDPEATGWGCYPMVPWAGRVREGRFHWRGQTVQLPLGAPPHAIHGTVFDQPWQSVGPARFRAEFGPHWPWSGTVESAFELVPGQLRWTLTVRGREPMPVTLGWHPWFRRQVDGLGRASLNFDPHLMYARDAAGIPSGTLVTPPDGPWDDCFTDLVSNPSVQYSDGTVIEVSSSCDHWVVYDERDYAFCVEPQSAPPDAFNLGPTAIAAPGTPVVHHMALVWQRP